MAAKAKQFMIVAGFNVGCTDENPGGTRYEPGTEKGPVLVDPKDLDKKVWDDLVDAGAIVAVEGE